MPTPPSPSGCRYFDAPVAAYLGGSFGGFISMQNVEFGKGAKGSFLSTTQGNIHVAARTNSTSPYAVSLRTRSSNDNVCLVTKEPAEIVERPDTNPSNCPGALGKSPRKWTLEFYDANRDGNITIQEFKNALHDKMGKFCNPLGPLALLDPSLQLPFDCDTLVAMVFPSVREVASYSQFGSLPGFAFFDALKATNDTTLFPRCRPKSLIADANHTYTVDVTLDTQEGEILFSKAPGGPRIISGTGVDVYSPPGKMPGLRLAKQSIGTLVDVRKQYGQRVESDTAQNDVMLVLHVQGSHDVPPGVYIYTSRSIFLLISPPFLTMVGAGALLPDVVQHTLYFTSGGCGPELDEGTRSSAGVWNVSSRGYQERIAQIHYQIKRAVLPVAQLDLRGTLVRVGSNSHGLLHGDYAVLKPGIAVSADGEVTWPDVAVDDTAATPTDTAHVAEEAFEGRYEDARDVVILSFVVALLASFYACWSILRAFKQVIIRRYDELKLRFQLGVRGIPEPDDATNHWLFMTLELPVEIFQVFIPYRAMLFDSITCFLQRHTVTYDPLTEGIDGKKLASKLSQDLLVKMYPPNKTQAKKNKKPKPSQLTLEALVNDGYRFGKLRRSYNAYVEPLQLA